jgi:hypothetical protein
MANDKIIIEIIKSHDCTGYHDDPPGMIRSIINENPDRIACKLYRAWDIDTENGVPEYIQNKVKSIRKGTSENNGIFINGEWFLFRMHNTQDAVSIKSYIYNHLGKENTFGVYYEGAGELKVDIRLSNLKNLFLLDNEMENMIIVDTNINNMEIIEGKINKLEINSDIKEFHYKGYDINTLIKLAKSGGCFEEAEILTGKEKKHILSDALEIRLLGLKDLKSGIHPCFIMGGKIDPESILHRKILKRYGGWGYLAAIHGDICGFAGIIPKDLMKRDITASITPSPDGIDDRDILFLYCIAGGSVFKKPRLSIGKRLVGKIIEDARMKEYKCIEAIPCEDNVGSLYETMGFEGKYVEVHGDKKRYCVLML